MEAYVVHLIRDADERTRKLKAVAEAAKSVVKSWTSGDPNAFTRAICNLERLLELLDDEQDI